MKRLICLNSTQPTKTEVNKIVIVANYHKNVNKILFFIKAFLI